MKLLVARHALIAALAAPLSALALVGGVGPSPSSADSPWVGVGSLSVNGSLFTATLIAPGYVLTAAHVVTGAEPAKIRFQLNAGSSQTISASQVFIHPGYNGRTSDNVPGDPTVHSDLAIIKLSSDVPFNVPVCQIFTGSLLNRDLNFVSFGGSTTTRTTGENMVDRIYVDGAGTPQTYLFDYDGPDLSSNWLGAGTLGENREAALVGGDSGSAAFVNVNGQWKLAGINTFRVTVALGTRGIVGTGGGGVILSSFLPWVTSVLTTAP
jgi:hypothetical protein